MRDLVSGSAYTCLSESGVSGRRPAEDSHYVMASVPGRNYSSGYYRGRF